MTKDIDRLKKDIVAGVYTQEFIKLYGSEAECGEKRYLSALASFEKCFGRREIRIFSAPGRTELCGNHTDHQGGCVLAAAINLDMEAVVAKREDSTVNIVSEGFETLEINIFDNAPKPNEKGTTAALVRGIASALSARGHTLGGFDAYLTSSVPTGSGLSSSAAFEVLTGKIFSALFCGDSLDALELAKIGQYAENVYFGKPCGLMDQISCAVGGVVFIDLSEPNYTKTEHVNFSFEKHGYALYITNAGGSHANLTEEYAAITGEMSAVAGCFGMERLSQVDEQAFREGIPELRRRVSDRAILRAMHFFAENRRVRQQLSFLKAENMEDYINSMEMSGRSSMGLLQNLWPEDKSERSVALALAVSDSALFGKGTSRVHGGGFAGTIQALVPSRQGESYEAVMNRVFGVGACQAVAVRAVGVYELN